MKNKYLEAWMDCLDRFSQTSEAQRLKVAAFLFKDGNMVSHAINGTPAGWESNVCEDKVYFTGGGWFEPEHSEYPYEDDKGIYKLVTKPEVIHAEEQCLDKMLHSHTTTDGCTMLVTHSPCLPCAIKIKSAGIKKIVYKNEYRSNDGVNYLRSTGVEVEKF